MTKKISLCMIVKNEEKNIRRCLESVASVVDEMIVLDTGSGDKTRQIAQECGATVQSFIWNDNFSDARNASLDLATGDWIFFLDGDEELTADSRAVLRRAVEQEGARGYFNKIINFAGNDTTWEQSEDVVFRLFPNKPEYRFRNAIHEQICDVISQHTNQSNYELLEDLVILHYGYLDSELLAKNKKKRNLVLLEKELSQHPHDILVRFHYAVELYRNGENLLAVTEFEKISARIQPQEVSYGAKLMRYILLSYYGINELSAALQAVQQGLALFPDYADLYHFGGVICYQLQEYNAAYEYFHKALQSPPQPVHYASFCGMQGCRSYYYLGQIAEKFCNGEEALGYYIKALQDTSNFTAALASLIPILQPRSDPAYAKFAIDKVCDSSVPQAKLLIGELLFACRAYGVALSYLGDLPLLFRTPQLILRQAICLMQEGRSLEALHLLDGIGPEEPLAPHAKLNKLLCFWFAGNYEKVRGIGEELIALGLAEDTRAVVQLLQTLDQKKKKLQFIGPEGMTLVVEIIERALALGKVKECSTLLARISHQSMVDEYLSLAENFYEYGELELAEGYLGHHLKKNGEGASVYFLLGQIKEQQELYFEAISYYQKALQLEPKEPKHYIKLIQLYEKIRRLLLEKAIKEYPEFPVLAPLLEEAETEICYQQ